LNDAAIRDAELSGTRMEKLKLDQETQLALIERLNQDVQDKYMELKVSFSFQKNFN